MKKIFALITAILTLSIVTKAEAQRVKPSIEIVLSDDNPFQITVNGRVFRNVNTKLTIKDLPARKNDFEIVRYCTNNDGKDCKKQLVFSGRIPMSYNKNYQAVVLVGEGKIRVSDDGSLFSQNNRVNTTQPAATTPTNTENNIAITPSAQESIEFQRTARLKSEANPAIKALGVEMNKLNSDAERVKRALHYLKMRNRNNTVADIHVISSWIMFDENKLSFVKDAYGYVNNSNEYHQLVQVFTMRSYAEEFEQYLNTLKKN